MPSYQDNYLLDKQNADKKTNELYNFEKKYNIKTNYGNWKKSFQEHEKNIKAIWTDKLGFEEANIHFINGHFIKFATQYGSLACLTNCIHRSPTPSNPAHI